MHSPVLLSSVHTWKLVMFVSLVLTLILIMKKQCEFDTLFLLDSQIEGVQDYHHAR